MTLLNPYVWLGIALACLLSFFGGCSKGKSLAETEQERADQKAAKIAQAKEDALQDVIWNVAYDAQQSRIAREAETNRTIAGLRAGTVKLRDRFTCPRVPSASQAIPGSDAAPEGGLRIEDAEFLVRESDRADGITEQLASCQATLTAYYQATQ